MKKKKRKVKHSATFIPRYLLLPSKIGKEYKQGATLLALAYKYNTHTADIRKRLDSLGVKVRRPGTQFSGIYPQQKLLPEQIAEILRLDEQNMSHMDISKIYGVTRERIRQICLRANHKTRRERMDKTIQLQEAREARKQDRLQKIAQIAEAWRAGFTLKEMSMLIWGRERPDPKTSSKISYFRQRYGKALFPWRRGGHWKILPEYKRKARIEEMAKDWRKHADIERITKKFGYRDAESARQMLTRYRKLYPGLFPTAKKIVWKN